MKAAFASALAYRPPLILLDEPFSGLDPLVRAELIEGLLDRAPEATIFLSSHDLAEIESSASHVGFLEQGRLLFSEEMSALSGRFREVTVTLEVPAPLPPAVPSHWLQPEVSGSVIRFVDSNFQQDITLLQRRNCFARATFRSSPCRCGPSFSPSPRLAELHPNLPPALATHKRTEA